MNETEVRKALHGKHFDYDVKKYPFKDALESLYGVPLEELHTTMGGFEKFERANDQQTLAHKVFYANFGQLIQPIYQSLIRDVIAEAVQYPFYYQVIPTFRIGLPGNRFVGEYHKDTKYNHQPYEVNFNVGLSNYLGNAALRSEDSPGSGRYISLECPYGQVFSFDHIDCIHGSNINDTTKTMVSFDFRLALKGLYYVSDASSVNLGTRFEIGSYFSNELVSSSAQANHSL